MSRLRRALLERKLQRRLVNVSQVGGRKPPSCQSRKSPFCAPRKPQLWPARQQRHSAPAPVSAPVSEAELVQQALCEALRQALLDEYAPASDQDRCGCGLSEQSRREMAHLAGMLQDVGEGSMAQGLEHLRDCIKRHLAGKRRMDKALMAAFTILIGSLTSAGLAALWLGLKHYLSLRTAP